MNIIHDAAQFLHETGLLAEINRVVLHPRGLALSIIAEMPGPNPFEEARAAGFGPLYDKRDDEGITFKERENASVAARLRAREADGTVPVRPQRAARLGFLVQPPPGTAPAPAAPPPERAPAKARKPRASSPPKALPRTVARAQPKAQPKPEPKAKAAPRRTSARRRAGR